eukprot:710852_1
MHGGLLYTFAVMYLTITNSYQPANYCSTLPTNNSITHGILKSPNAEASYRRLLLHLYPTNHRFQISGITNIYQPLFIIISLKFILAHIIINYAVFYCTYYIIITQFIIYIFSINGNHYL